MKIRNILRLVVRKLGFDGMERERFDRLLASEQASSTYPLLLQDIYALYVNTTEHVYLVHVGANDGVKDDFTSFLREPSNVFSVLVEPQRHCLPKLSLLKAENPQISVLPVAFGETNGEATLYRFDHEFEKDIQLDVFSSFDIAMLEDKKRYFSLQSEIISDQVETCTLNTILTRVSLPRMDVLICDIEGLDHRVIEQLVETVCPLPVIIVFEQRWLTADQRKRCYRLLSEQGYCVLHGAEDAWCYRLRPEIKI